MISRRTFLLAAAAIPGRAQVNDDAALPRVLLIGDSISIGYAPAVRKFLDGKANVHLIPVNGGPTTNGLKNLSAWLGEGRWNAIHFNWGLHDLRIMEDGAHQVPIETYERNLGELVARLKTTGAKLIWCSTTPVPEGKLSPPRRPEDVPRYNEIAARVMQANGIAINDLYGFALPRLAQIQRPENVHFTEEGSEQLAKTVAEAVVKALGR